MEEIKQLLKITRSLENNPKYKGRKFSLDGKLVGDIGEVLAAEKYGLELLPPGTKVYDAIEKGSKRKIQIKSTFKGNSYFPYGDDRIPNYFLCIKIHENGKIEELFNGPGKFILDKYIIPQNKRPYKELYYHLSGNKLKELNSKVPDSEKIKVLISDK